MLPGVRAFANGHRRICFGPEAGWALCPRKLIIRVYHSRMTPERERWAEAIAIKQRYGDQPHAHIAEQVARLALAGDQAGVIRWREIATRFDQLQAGTMQ